MLAPKLIGVASETNWSGLPYGVLVTAGVWAAQGLRVFVVDAEPADLALTSPAHAQPQRVQVRPALRVAVGAAATEPADLGGPPAAGSAEAPSPAAVEREGVQGLGSREVAGGRQARRRARDVCERGACCQGPLGEQLVVAMYDEAAKPR